MIAGQEDVERFSNVAEGQFDNPIQPDLLKMFLSDERHHIAIALNETCIVGFVSAVDYIHPDKPRELWINEAGVSEPWRKRGIAKALMQTMLEHAKQIGCAEAWVLTEPENTAANALYGSVRSGSGTEKVSCVMCDFLCS